MKEPEKKANELLMLLGKELAQNREAFMNETPLSERKEVSVRKNRSKAFAYSKRIALIFLVCLIFVSSVTIVSTEADFAHLFGFVFEKEEGHENIKPTSSTISMEKYEPSYLPEGYEKVSEENVGNGYILVYCNESTGDSIHLMQIDDASFSASFDTESTEREACFVGESKGYILLPEDGQNENYILIWQIEDTYFELTSTLGKETLLEIGSSIEKQ